MSWFEGSYIHSSYDAASGYLPRAGGGAVASGSYIPDWYAYGTASTKTYRGTDKFTNFNVAIAGRLVNHQIQSCTWTIGRSDWFSTLTGSSASISLIGDVDAEPGDEVVIHTTADVLFSGFVDTISQTQELNGTIRTNVTVQDVVAKLGQTDLTNVTLTSGTVDNVLSQILTMAGMNATVNVAPTVNSLPTLNAITGYTGDALSLINRIEQSTNSLVFAQPDGSVVVSLRDAMADYGQNVASGRYAVAPTRHLRMDEASGNLASVPSGLTGTAAGGPTYRVQGPFGASPYAIEFDGTDDTFNFGDVLDLGTDYTIAGWAYWPGSKGSDDTIIYKRVTSPSNAGWFAYISDSTGRFDFVMQSGGVEITNIPDDAPSCPIDEWFHWAVVEDGNYVYLYVNGSEVARGSTAGDAPNTTGNLHLGSFGGFANWFRGRMAHVSVWQDTALTQDEIKTLVNPSLLLDGENAPSTWMMDKSVTTVINAWDLTANGSSYLSASKPDSIERYGLRAYQVNEYLPSNTIPITQSLIDTVADPRYVLSGAELPIDGYANKAYLLKPLDLVTRNEQTLQVLSVSQSVDTDSWRVTIAGDQTSSMLSGESFTIDQGEEVAPPEPPSTAGTKTRTLTFDADRDAVAYLGESGQQYGSGKGDYLPVGYWQGKKFRVFIHFPMSLPSDTIRITKAYLTLKTSSQFHMAFGGSPKTYIKRVTQNWSEGTQGGTNLFHFDNALRWDNQPNVTSSDQKLVSINDVEGNVVKFAITEIARDWHSGNNYGLRLSSENESSTNRNIEFRSRELGSGPKLTVTIEVPA